MASEGEDMQEGMTLAGQSSRFTMVILRYESPQIEQHKWDSNWLIVQGQVNLEGREWSFCDSCLTTFEAAGLADWLDALSRGEATKPYCAFTEPNLEFDLATPHSIRISFALESAPPWAKHDDDWAKHSFEAPVGPELAVAAAELRRQLTHFPERG
jgi:hypothetical protein